MMMKDKVSIDELSVLDAIKTLNDREVDAYTVPILDCMEEAEGKTLSRKKLVRILKHMENQGYVTSRMAQEVRGKGSPRRIYKVLKTVPL